MKRHFLLISLSFLFTHFLMAQEKSNPVGWAVYNYQLTGGGNKAPIVVSTFSDFKKEAESAEPKVIYVQGEIGTGTRNKAGDVIYVKSNKTIIGNTGAVLKGSLRVYDESNIIFKNLIIEGQGSTESQGFDCMTIKNGNHIWIDHCEFKNGEDGNLDIIRGSDNVSVTWCIFRYTINSIHNLSNNIGAKDIEPESLDKLKVTFQYCWWDGCTQRMPRVRYGKVQVANCLFTNRQDVPIAQGAVAGGNNSNIRVESCHFIDIANPIRIKENTPNAVIKEMNNLFTNCTGRKVSDAVGSPLPTVFDPPYTLNLVAASKVKDLVSSVDNGAGATMKTVNK